MNAVTVLHFDLEDDLHRRAKVRAASEGIPLKAWVARAIKRELDAEETKQEAER